MAALVIGSDHPATSRLCEAVVIDYQHCSLGEICQTIFNSLVQRHWSLLEAREVGGNRCRVLSNWSVKGHQKGRTPPPSHPD